MAGIITLITDFGTVDGYVGALKGAIVAVNPQVNLVDITHDIPAQDISGGAFALGNCWHVFPKGTVHVVVVDPGVGTDRRPLVVSAGGQFFVAPDNGVLTHVLRRVRVFDAYQIADERYWRHPLSNTFHGRDIFAPVAAHLVSGLPPWRVGPAVENLVELAWPTVVQNAKKIEGHVQHIDRFGNIISDIPANRCPVSKMKYASVGDLDQVTFGLTYGETAPGTPIALVGSHGYVEIGISSASAAQRTCTRVGMPFVIYLET